MIRHIRKQNVSIIAAGNESCSIEVIFTGPDLISVIRESVDAFASVQVPYFNRLVRRTACELC